MSSYISDNDVIRPGARRRHAITKLPAGWAPADRDIVDVTDEQAVSYWCREFGVVPDELLGAVEIAGLAAQEVENELQVLGLGTVAGNAQNAIGGPKATSEL